MKKAGMMKRYTTWMHFPVIKMANWEVEGRFSRVVAGERKKEKCLIDVSLAISSMKAWYNV